MPLRDHFRSPLDDKHSWDELHGLWPAVIVQHIVKVLPEPYFAAPQVHLGSVFEVDIGTFRAADSKFDNAETDGGLALATYAPPKPTMTMEPEYSDQDVYEIRIFDSRRQRRLVAAIELVSPSNKDRPDHRDSFAAKMATLLRNEICVTIVDVVSTLDFNFYAELMDRFHGTDPAVGDNPPAMYAVTLRSRSEGRRRLLDNWYHPLIIGQILPTLPIWLTEHRAISLELEATYDETCRTLRMV